MTSLLIPPSRTNYSSVTPRWLTDRVANGLYLQGYLVDRSDIDRAMSGEGLPALNITVPAPGYPEGFREFLITVEELS